MVEYNILVYDILLIISTENHIFQNLLQTYTDNGNRLAFVSGKCSTFVII